VTQAGRNRGHKRVIGLGSPYLLGAQGEGETLQQRRSSGLVKFLELAQAADGSGGGGGGMMAPNAAAGAFGRGPYPPSLLSSIKCAPCGGVVKRGEAAWRTAPGHVVRQARSRWSRQISTSMVLCCETQTDCSPKA
jgi:hypothetical protein